MKNLLFFTFLALLIAGPAFGATAVTVNDITETEQSITYTIADTSTGNSFTNKNGDVFLIFTNGGGSTQIATIAAQNISFDVSGWGPLSKAANAVSVAAAATIIVGPHPPRAYNDSNGLIQVTYDGQLSVAAFRVP